MLERIWKKVLRCEGFTPWTLLRPLLWAVSLAYYLLHLARRSLSHVTVKVSVPVLSVGNISVGGTGKTPLVAFIARQLSERGWRVGIAASGYGRRGKQTVCGYGKQLVGLSADEIGDEVKLLAQMLPEVVIAVDRSKAEASKHLAASGKVDLIIVDDGFQHARLARDLDVVVIDASVPLRLYHLFPLGIQREPLSGLKRADVIVLSRASLGADLPELTARLKRVNSTAPRYRAEFGLSELVGNWRRFPVSYMRDKSVMLFAGVGNFPALRKEVEKHSARVVHGLELGDHQRYDQTLLQKIRRLAEQQRPDFLLTTAKDWTKVSSFDFGREIYYVAQTVKLEPEAEQFIAFIATQLGRMSTGD
ncbi:MAG: tetraacyldisaccharide 4'-kinase [Candidatus Zixiibacteriota bacterium]